MSQQCPFGLTGFKHFVTAQDLILLQTELSIYSFEHSHPEGLHTASSLEISIFPGFELLLENCSSPTSDLLKSSQLKVSIS